MSRRRDRFRRSTLVALYLALLAGWAALAYDTYGVWLRKQEQIAHGLALAALGPTALPAALAATLVPPTPAEPLPTVPPTAVPDSTPGPSPTPAPDIAPTTVAVTHPKTGRFIAAWLPTAFDADQARASFEANKDILDEVSPYWYTAAPDTGALVPEDGARDRGLVDAAHAANVLVLPTLHNVYQPEAILPLLEDPARRTAHIDAIMEEVRAYNFDGIDIDYEQLPATALGAYSDFMRELSAVLHAEGKLLTVAVHAKTSDDGGHGAFQDWALLGEICDRVRIMTYDYSWTGGAPGPIAPVTWVAGVTEYARAVLPPAKIQLGIPFYAYNWLEGEPARSETWADVQQLISTHQPNVNLLERDAQGPIEESWFTYSENGQQRTVWFSSARALDVKLDLVEREDLGGIAIWRLGNEDPGNWAIIRERGGQHPATIQRLFDTYLPEH